MTRRIPALALAVLVAFTSLAPSAHAEGFRFSERPWWSFLLSWLTPAAGAFLPASLEPARLRNSVTIDPSGRTTTTPAGDTPAYGLGIDPLGLTTTSPAGDTPAYGGMIDPLGRDTTDAGVMIDPLG